MYRLADQFANLWEELTRKLDPLDRMRRLRQAGNEALQQFEQSGQSEDLDSAIRCLRLAAEQGQRDHIEGRRCLSDLVSAISTRFHRPNGASYIDEIVRTCEELLKSTPYDDEDWSVWVPRRRNLRNALLLKQRHRESGQDSDSSIETDQKPTNAPSTESVARDELAYVALQPKQIRLLEFIEGTEYACKMQECSIDKCPKYTAVSYTWEIDDDRDPSHGIDHHMLVNGQRLTIQQNLYDALGYLKAFVKRFGHMVWVDTVCIDQHNMEEKATHVKNMNSVYEGAENIFVWLGLPYIYKEVSLAKGLMQRWVANSGLTYPISPDHPMFSRPWREFIIVENWSFPHQNQPEVFAAWEGIAYLFGRRYWQRTWTYQEVTTPKAIYFYCGDINFNELEFGAALVQAERYQDNPSFGEYFTGRIGPNSQTKNTLAARGIRDRAASDAKRCLAVPLTIGKPLSLLNLLEATRILGCKDPRDSVFAAVGLANDLERDEIVVNYERDLVDIFTDVVRFAKRSGAGLAVLGFVVTPRRKARISTGEKRSKFCLFSWVPDWTQGSENVMPLGPLRRCIFGVNEMYDPCRGTTITMSISDRQLTVRGFHIDAISHLHTKMELSDLTSRSTLQCVKQSLRQVGGIFTDDLFNQTLVADTRMEMETEKRGAGVDWDMLESKAAHLNAIERDKRFHMIMALEATCWRRKLGILRNGYLGVFPDASEPGDVVAAFHGGHILYVIRPRGILSISESTRANYEFIGECYVAGLMDGEAMHESFTLKGETIDIVLI